MAAETVIIFAHATGRTLVLPPMARWYLLSQSSTDEENLSNFDKFFDLTKLFPGLNIITMETFLEHVAGRNLLKVPLLADGNNNNNNMDDKAAIQIRMKELLKPPKKKLWEYLEKACYIEQWQPGKQFVGINFKHPYTTSNNNINSSDIILTTYDTNSNRYKEMVAHGRKLRPYDVTLYNERAIYFTGDYRDEYRILTHFYTYIYWENKHIANIYKRIVRDRMHYHDIIFCAASYIIELIHKESALLDNKLLPIVTDKKTGSSDINMDNYASYHAAHIRRGDFQYHDMKLPADEIWNNIQHLYNFTRTRLLYISTDEKNKKFFEPFYTTKNNQRDITIRYINDYLDKLPNFFNKENNGYSFNDGLHVNKNHIGMIEQIICANAHTFVGTPLSTFTGYITRMRGK
jgi:hypothetical protein